MSGPFVSAPFRPKIYRRCPGCARDVEVVTGDFFAYHKREVRRSDGRVAFWRAGELVDGPANPDDYVKIETCPFSDLRRRWA